MTSNYSMTDLKISCDEASGRFRGAYFRIRAGKCVKTVEISEGSAFADYDSEGCLLGIEAIGPCEISTPNQLQDGNIALPREVLENVPENERVLI